MKTNEMKPWEGIKAFEPEEARGNVICSELLGGNQLIHQRHFGSCRWLIQRLQVWRRAISLNRKLELTSKIWAEGRRGTLSWHCGPHFRGKCAVDFSSSAAWQEFCISRHQISATATNSSQMTKCSWGSRWFDRSCASSSDSCQHHAYSMLWTISEPEDLRNEDTLTKVHFSNKATCQWRWAGCRQFGPWEVVRVAGYKVAQFKSASL